MTQIIPLSEGTFTIGHDKVFHPFNETKDDLTKRPKGSLLVEIQPFLMVTDKDIILLDTGLGFNNPDGQNHLSANLSKNGFNPTDVTKVLLSHLHKDHAGGINPDLFHHATFYVYKKEMEYAEKIGYPSYFTKELQSLKTAPNVTWLEGESGDIDNYIHFKHTNGHCPEHVVYTINTDNGIFFFGGDEAPQYRQMKYKYIAKYDFDGRHAMNLREQWAKQGAKENWQFLFYHDVKTPIARLSSIN